MATIRPAVGSKAREKEEGLSIEIQWSAQGAIRSARVKMPGRLVEHSPKTAWVTPISIVPRPCGSDSSSGPPLSPWQTPRFELGEVDRADPPRQPFAPPALDHGLGPHQPFGRFLLAVVGLPPAGDQRMGAGAHSLGLHRVCEADRRRRRRRRELEQGGVAGDDRGGRAGLVAREDDHLRDVRHLAFGGRPVDVARHHAVAGGFVRGPGFQVDGAVRRGEDQVRRDHRPAADDRFFVPLEVDDERHPGKGPRFGGLPTDDGGMSAAPPPRAAAAGAATARVQATNASSKPTVPSRVRGRTGIAGCVAAQSLIGAFREASRFYVSGQCSALADAGKAGKRLGDQAGGAA